MTLTLGMNRGDMTEIEQAKREPGMLPLQVIGRGIGTIMSELLGRS